MALVEREHHFARLEAALREAGTGRSRIVLCSGPTGSGKTALIRAFAGLARDNGVRVVEARASTLQRDQPLSVLRRMVDAAAPHLSAAECGPDPGLESLRPIRLPPIARGSVAGDGALSRPPPDAGPVAVREAPEPPPALSQPRARSPEASQDADEVWRSAAYMLGRITAPGPALLCLDDVQFADRSSLEMLFFLLREEPEKAALLVLAERESAGPPHPAILAEQAQNPGFEHLAVRPLSVEAVRSLIRQVAQEPTADRMSIHFHGATGGNPLLVQGLLRDYESRATGCGDPRYDGALDSYQQAVQCCLARDDPVVRATAQALAVLGPAGTPRNIAGLLGTAPTAVEAAMRALESVGLTSSGVLRQPRAVDAVLQAVPAEDRAALHLRSARLLYDEGAYDLAVAEHLRESGRVQSSEQPCEPWVIRTLIRAARQAEQTLAYPAVIEYLSLARLASHGAPEEAEVNRLLLCARWRDDPATGLRQMADLADAARSVPHDAAVALSPVPYLLWFGKVEEAFALVRSWAQSPAEARAGAVSGVPKPIIEVSRLCFAYLYPGWAEKSAALLAQREPGGAHPRPGGLREALDAASRRDFISTLLSAEAPETALPSAAAALGMQLYAGELDAADACCRMLLDHRAVRTSTMWRALLTAVQAEIALRAGNPELAEETAARAMESVSAEGWGVALAGPISTRVSALTELGRLAEAEQLLEIPLPEAAWQTFFGLHHRIARGRFHAAAGKPNAALHDFTVVGDQLKAWKLDQPSLPVWRVEAAAAAAGCHETALARKLLQEQLAELREGQVSLRALALHRLALLSDLRHRPAMLSEVVGLRQRAGDLEGEQAARHDLEAALRALESAAQKLAPSGPAEEAGSARRQPGIPRQQSVPRQTYQTGLASALAHAAQQHKRGSTGLSRAERKVAALAAEGRTNRQIADTLFLTVSTVEQHLTRIYRKLGVSNRDELKRFFDLER